MRIEKTIKGEIVPYHIYFIPYEMKVNVKYFFSDESVVGVITEDFKHIILPDTFLSPYISGHGRVKVEKFKLSRRFQTEAKDYNPNHIKK